MCYDPYRLYRQYGGREDNYQYNYEYATALEKRMEERFEKVTAILEKVSALLELIGSRLDNLERMKNVEAPAPRIKKKRDWAWKKYRRRSIIR